MRAAARLDLIVNVKDKGALGDGRTDDTAAIQAAIDAIGGTKGTVLVPKGVYMIDAVDNRLHLKDDMTLELADGAVLKAIPNDSKKYSLLTISGVANVWVTGGTLEGERDQHKGKSGEWGYGLHINKGAKHITVSNLVCQENVGRRLLRARRRGRALLRRHRRRQPPPGIVDHPGQWSSGVELRVQEHAWHAAGAPASISSPTKRSKRSPMSASSARNSSTMQAAASWSPARRRRVTKVEMTRNVFRNNRPFVLENAPNVAASICGNRQVNTQTETGGGFNAYADPIDVVALQNDCGDPSFVIDKVMTKKKKKQGAD